MTTKICSSCKRLLPVDDFSFKNKHKGVLQSKCKQCYNSHNRDYYHAAEQIKQKIRAARNSSARSKVTRARYQEWKSSRSCVICKESASECLDLHHLDNSKKERSISELVSGWSWAKIENELSKCIVVCSNCHRKIHSGRIQCPRGADG